MGNVASWSGSKTLTCFQYYDQTMKDFSDPKREKLQGYVHVNWASRRNNSTGGRMGPTMDAPTYRGPFKNIETEGYPSQHECYPFSGNAIHTVVGEIN